MDSLKRMVVFSHVAETRSFSAAARRLGIARSAVSRQIALLEASVGARLLNRTTRSVSLTDAGETYYRSCVRVIDEMEAATQRIKQLRDEPSGVLRVAGPTGFGTQLASLASGFARRHAGLDLELLLDDRLVDMVDEGIDVSVRIGWLSDSSLIARHLCDSPRVLCASPDYIERHGMPRAPGELATHRHIIFTRLPTPHQLTFTHNGRKESVPLKGRIKTNSAIAVRALVLNGSGISTLSHFLVDEDIVAGRLVHLLPEYDCGSAGIHAVYHDRHYQQAKVRLFVDYLRAHLKV